MRRAIVFALMIPLLLAGCAGGTRDENEWKQWCAALSAAGTVSFSAEITSRGGRDTVTFSADVRRTDGTVTLTVTAPETIRGVTVSSSGDGAELVYQDLILELDALREDALPPCAAGKLLFSALETGLLLWTGRDADGRTAAFSGPEETTVTLRRDADGTPVYAEIARDGAAELTVRIDRWQIGE